MRPTPLLPVMALGLLLLLGVGAGAARAEEPTPPAAREARPSVEVPGEHVEAALAEAGANRPELERFLAHYEALGDPARRSAARFLVANMPGKGYVVTALKDAQGKVIPYDPLAYPDFEAALQAFEALEKQHGAIDFARDHLVSDLATLRADFLLAHVEEAFAAWEGAPPARRVGFQAFLDHVLPYRGSEEPAEPWLAALRARQREAGGAPPAEASAAEAWDWVNREVSRELPFNERYYLHPTDQGFAEMLRSRQGRCEDITNRITYGARSLGLATAADYTPAWAHRDNNHAWNVLLDAQGRGRDPGQAHAAKVYRKTFALQRDSLAFRLPPGREAPNRFLASRSYVDVTDQYTPTSDVRVTLAPALVPDGERFAYLCVFNGGEWVAIHWAPLTAGAQGAEATFTKMGRGPRGLLYQPALHDGRALRPVGPPLLLHPDGAVTWLPGTTGASTLLASATGPAQTSPDTHVTTPPLRLEAGTTYLLQAWQGGAWVTRAEVPGGTEALSFEGLPADGLYWLLPRESRRLERPFTIEYGRQRFW